MALPGGYREQREREIGHERTCPCGCAMIWSEQWSSWLCLHCDLDEVSNYDD